MPSKEYVLTNHARERMSDRGISEEEIELVLRNPEITHPGPCGDINAIRTISQRRIKVSYIMAGKKKRVITAMVLT